MTSIRRLLEPHRSRVQADDRGRPQNVDGRGIAQMRESWLIEDAWWTARPIRRRYWELVTDSGADIVVFHDLQDGRWYRHR